MKEFSAFSLLLTENCNLACKYCYEGVSTGHRDVRMTPELAIQTVDWMFRQRQGARELSVSMFGGEPTLMPDIIDVICKRGKELSARTGVRFSVNMITNATVMNEKLYNIIKSHLDIWTSTQLSVDGPHDIQDEYRVTKSGKGTFDTIEKNLPYWKKLFGNMLTVHGVLNKKSIPRLFESYLYFKEAWDEHTLWFLPAKSKEYTQEDIDLYDREMGKIYGYILDKVMRNRNINEVQAYAPIDKCLSPGGMSKPCGAGDNYCTVTATGDVYPCHHFYYIDPEEQLKMGNIHDGVDPDRKRIWDEFDNSDMQGCEGCSHGNCYRCPAENYEINGSPFIQAKGTHCQFMKIDEKYQKMMRKELVDMGLVGDGGKQNHSIQHDCVGKEGDCALVTSVGQCKFDRELEADRQEDAPMHNRVSFDDVVQTDHECCGGENCDDGGCGSGGCGGGSCSSDKVDSPPQEWVGKTDLVDDVPEMEMESPNVTLKNILSEVIEVLAKYHNKL